MADVEFEVKNTVTPAMEALGKGADDAVMAGLRRVAGIIQNMEIREAQGIYKRPIPTVAQDRAYKRAMVGAFLGKNAMPETPKRVGGKGKKLWERTGDLMRAIEAAPIEGTGEISLKVDLPYARSRHQLGVYSSAIAGPFKGISGWVPRAPSLGVRRENPWASRALERTDPQIQPAFEAAYLRALNGKEK